MPESISFTDSPTAPEATGRMRCLLTAIALVLVLAAPSEAAFSGSTGKLAYIADGGGLVIDDPHDDAPAGDPIAQGAGGGAGGMTPPSAPQWSPDGTRLLYTEAVANGSMPYDHSAVFVINADGSDRRQVTAPFPGKVESCPTCKDEESAWDTQPVWKDDDTIAFVRWVAAGDNADHEAQEGMSVRTASAAGGGDTLLRHYPNENQEGVPGLIWPAGWSEPVVIHVNAGGYSLRKVVSGTTLASAAGITDVDASPDGERLVYTAASPSGFRIVTIDRAGRQVDSFSPGIGHPSWVRFTPDGNGLVIPGCAADWDGEHQCGLITHRLPDPDADVRPDEAVEAPFLDLDIFAVEFPAIPGNRSHFDLQSQDLPVIYVPGFLGSEITCDGQKVWMPSTPPLRFQKMQLADDGTTNATCASAAPTGKPVEYFLGADVYAHADQWLARINPPGGWKTFGWDWRKAPQESLSDLDALITSLTNQPLALKQGAKRVSLVGHSYGALLMRAYVNDLSRSKKVARMLTVGAPYWGSPKPLFSVAFGIELPSFSAIDLMADNDDLRDFARNMAGAYHLFPSDNYGAWLRLNGTQLDQAGAASWLASVGGNRGLLERAWGTHRDMLDGYFDRQGRIDYRVVVGVGLQTIGQINLVSPGPDGESVTAGVNYQDGDGTVTGRSATQGPIGTLDPLGDDVHIQNRCGIAHMDQTKDAVVQDAYSQFLATGRLPRRLPAANCPPSGREIEVFHGLEIAPPAGASAAGIAAAGPMALGDAAFAELADVVRLPGRTLIVTNDARPVDLTFEADGLRFGVTDLRGSERGAQEVYGPVTGTVVLGGDGAVSVDGVPITPEPKADPPAVEVPSPASPALPADAAGPVAPVTRPVTAARAVSERCRLARRALAKANTKLTRAKRAVRKRPSKANRKSLTRARKARRAATLNVKRAC